MLFLYFPGSELGLIATVVYFRDTVAIGFCNVLSRLVHLQASYRLDPVRLAFIINLWMNVCALQVGVSVQPWGKSRHVLYPCCFLVFYGEVSPDISSEKQELWLRLLLPCIVTGYSMHFWCFLM